MTRPLPAFGCFVLFHQQYLLDISLPCIPDILPNGKDGVSVLPFCLPGLERGLAPQGDAINTQDGTSCSPRPAFPRRRPLLFSTTGAQWLVKLQITCPPEGGETHEGPVNTMLYFSSLSHVRPRITCSEQTVCNSRLPVIWGSRLSSTFLASWVPFVSGLRPFRGCYTLTGSGTGLWTWRR